MRLHQVVPQLYQRGAFFQLPDKVEGLRAAGIEIVVSLWRADPDIYDVVEYHHLPTPDGQQVDGVYDDMAVYLARQVGRGRTTLVHCHGGRNRSGLLNALVVRQLYRCTGVDAAHIVRLGRPGALANPYFARYLSGLPAPSNGRPATRTPTQASQDGSAEVRTAGGRV